MTSWERQYKMDEHIAVCTHYNFWYISSPLAREFENIEWVWLEMTSRDVHHPPSESTKSFVVSIGNTGFLNTLKKISMITASVIWSVFDLRPGRRDGGFILYSPVKIWRWTSQDNGFLGRIVIVYVGRKHLETWILSWYVIHLYRQRSDSSW